jgi:hypothetical protein
VESFAQEQFATALKRQDQVLAIYRSLV